MINRVPRWPLLVSSLTAMAIVATTHAADVKPSVPKDLAEKPYLYEIVRHLYRWYLDEKDLDQTIRGGELVFWVRELHPKLEPEDQSRFGEIICPGLGVRVKVKKAHYAVPELDLVVRNDTFKIFSVARAEMPERMPAGCTEVNVSYPALRDYAYRNRNKVQHPSGDLLMHIRLAVRKKLVEEVFGSEQAVPTGDQVIHLSPLSPVANEAWVFWETGRLLIRFASDTDLAQPAMWQHDSLAVKLYDIDEQVVVSLDEVAGSNAYMTRDQVGRVLFNCIVMGKRLVIKPLKNQNPREP